MKEPTIDDVAAAAGVSNMTVSRVANGAAHVREATRQRVIAAMQRLGYKPNSLAKGMRSNVTRTVGFILPDFTNATNATVAQTVERIMAAAGYRILFASTGFDLNREQQLLEDFQTKAVDGLILFLTDESSVRSVELIAASRVPVVIVDRDVPVAADYVLSEHRAAMGDVVRYLASLGHRRIGLIAAPLTIRPGRERHDAFRSTLTGLGLPVDETSIRTPRLTIEDGYQAAVDMLRRPGRPTALIVGANQFIFGAMRAVRELGIAVPADLSLVGADENLASALIEPPLTVIWRDQERIGESAARLLLDRMGAGKSNPPRTATVQSEIILRGSCGPPRPARA